MNHVEVWLDLLRAYKANLPKLISLYEARPQTPNCPTVLLCGQSVSDSLYTSAETRAALDAWDVGRVTSFDIVRWAKFVLGGEVYARAKRDQTARA